MTRMISLALLVVAQFAAVPVVSSVTQQTTTDGVQIALSGGHTTIFKRNGIPEFMLTQVVPDPENCDLIEHTLLRTEE